AQILLHLRPIALRVAPADAAEQAGMHQVVVDDPPVHPRGDRVLEALRRHPPLLSCAATLAAPRPACPPVPSLLARPWARYGASWPPRCSRRSWAYPVGNEGHCGAPRPGPRGAR